MTSEPKMPGLQAVAEKTVQTVQSGLSGATLVGDRGFSNCSDTGS